MSGRRLLALLGAAATAFVAGCGSAAGPAGASPAGPPPPSLATSLTTGAGTWAVAELGGPAAAQENFWELFVRPAAGGTWRLVTPPGMASNGGLVLAAPGGQNLTAAFRPSQRIRFSPLAVTADGGGNWTPGLLDAGLADAPGALASAAGGGRLLALVSSGAVEVSRPGGVGWSALATRRKLAASAPGRRCGLAQLTAVAFTPAGTPLAGGSCARPGTAGVFELSNGTWRAAGPSLPGSVSGQPVSVLRLALAANGDVALLSAGAGAHAVLLAAWLDAAGRWDLSPALPLRGAMVRSASIGPAGQVGLVIGAHGGAALAGPGASWRRLPGLPPGTQTLAPGPGPVEALAARQSALTVWQLNPAGSTWAVAQRLHVPVQYGSSN